MADDDDGDPNVRMIQRNRKAWHNYEIVEKIEAGLVLKGSEVKSIRALNVSIMEAHARPVGEELFILGMDIQQYAQAGPFNNHEPRRARKLLLHKREIRKLLGKIKEKGLTLVPLSLYFKDGRAKLELGLAQGKKQYDKRASLKKRDAEREMRRRTLKR